MVDGLLRFSDQHGHCELIGFINGVEGILTENFIDMRRDTFKNHMNLGGIDYIGRGPDKLRTLEEKQRVGEVCEKLGVTGLILVGATATLTDAAYLSQYFIDNKIKTSVIVIPCTVDGNIHHKYI